MSRSSRRPVRVKRGNSTVTIYKADRKKNGRMYREFKLAYYNEIGKRTLQSFNSFKKARKAADNVNVSLMKGEVKSLVLSNDPQPGVRLRAGPSHLPNCANRRSVRPSFSTAAQSRSRPGRWRDQWAPYRLRTLETTSR